MDALVFYEFCEKLTDIFLDEEEVKIGNDGTLRLTDLDNNDKPNITYDNESEYLTLNDLKPDAPEEPDLATRKESQI